MTVMASWKKDLRASGYDLRKLKVCRACGLKAAVPVAEGQADGSVVYGRDCYECGLFIDLRGVIIRGSTKSEDGGESS